MTCYHPLKRWIIGYDKKDFADTKEIAKVTSYSVNELEINGKKYTNWQEIPCGKCIGCRLAYSKTWAMRCMLEAKDHENNEFVTLTYDEEHVPKCKYRIDTETGEVKEINEVNTLYFEHLKKFMKDLRRYIEYHAEEPKPKREDYKNNEDYQKDKEKWEKKYLIRYYACGEYGSEKKTMRPHFHAIIYNLNLKDKKIDELSKKGSIQFKSEMLEKIWGKGRVRTSPVNYETCAYVARYIMKKVKGKEAVEFFESTGRTLEATRMSRMPGIGRKYYDKNKDKIYECDEIWLKNKYGALPMKPPRYYDNLYDLEEPEKMEQIKEQRKKIAEEIEKSRLEETGIDKLDYLKQKEEHKKEQIKRLKRQIS